MQGGIMRVFAIFMLLAFWELVSMSSAAAVTISPSTWNIIGLDSNTPASGPNRFPVGAKVCGGTPGAIGTATLTWDAGGTDPGGTYIYLRPGSANPLTFVYGADTCGDAYFEVEVNKVSAAYNQTRRFHITSGGVSTTVPRELFVEHLVSQARNGIRDVKLDGVSTPAGGHMSMYVGSTYDLELSGFTATGGYNQLESFINIPNTIFQVLSVTSAYNIVDIGSYDVPTNKLYANACNWVNDPSSPIYLSCISDFKAGGDPLTVKYRVKIIGGGGTSQTLGSLIYDFSGSSFHYNADFSVGARIADIIDPNSVTITKSFSPNPTNAGGISTLTFTLGNPNGGAISGLRFTDVFPVSPGAMTLSSTTVTNTCGGAITNSAGGALAVGDVGIKLSGGVVPANGSCTIQVVVTPAATGTYTNTSNNLFVDTALGPIDTGKSATAQLVVNNTVPPPPPPSACAAPVTIATWTMPATGQGSGGPPPPYTTKAADVAFANATFMSVSGAGLNNTINTVAMGTPANTPNSWAGTVPVTGWVEAPTSSANYFQFDLDTSKYGGLTVTFDVGLFASGDWANPNSNIYVKSSANGGAYTLYNTVPVTTYPQAAKGAWTLGLVAPAATTGTTNTTFRFSTDGAGNNKPNASFQLDNVIFKGCPIPLPPTITKSFATPTVAVGGSSNLTLTITNPNSCCALSGVAFTDALPQSTLLGTVAATNASPAVLGTGTAFKTQLVVGSIIFISGVSYTVLSITDDTHLTLTASYAAATASGLAATAGLTLSGAPTTTCGGTVTGAAGGTSISLSGGVLAAGASCTVTATAVKDSIAGVLNNVSGKVTATESGNNNTGTGYATAQITAILPPVISKLFAPNPVTSGGISTLTFTVSNPNMNNALSGVAFSDAFPATMVVASPVSTGAVALTFAAAGRKITRSTGSFIADGFAIGNKIATDSALNPGVFTITGVTALSLIVSETVVNETVTKTIFKYSTRGCGAPTFTPVAAAGSIAFSNGSIAAGGTCTVTVSVTATATGTNTSGAVSATTAGAGNTASDILTINPPFPDVFIYKDVAATNNASTVWLNYLTVPVNTGSVYYQFTVQNGGNVTLNNITVSDPGLPAGLLMSNCSWYYGYSFADRIPANLIGTGASIPALTIANTTDNHDSVTCVLGPYTPIVAGTFSNTATASAATYGGGTACADPVRCTDTSQATYATTDLTIAKSATETNFAVAGDILHYSYLVTNSGAAILTGPITVADNKTTVTCPAISTVGNLDNYLNPGEALTCTATYTVQAADVTATFVTNTASATAVGSNVSSAAVSKTITLLGSGVTVSGQLYSDSNHNGILDSGETWAGGSVYAKLFAGACPVAGPAAALSVQTLTAPTGAYTFTGVAAGSYCIVLSSNATATDTAASVPAGWLNVMPASGILSLTVASLAVANQNFGLFNGSKLSGRVFSDTGNGGGIANDGLQNGAEAGISGVTVSAAGCAGVCATALSDGNGDYSIWLPASAAGALTLTEANLSGYLSTGGQAGNTGGVYTRSTDTTAFTMVAGNNYSGVNFADVPGNQFLTDGVQSALPGSVVFYPHSFIAGTGGSVSFALSKVSSPAVAGWSEVIYVDGNCNAVIDPAETIMPASVAVTAGQTLCLLVKEFVPAAASIGAQNALTLTATFNATFSGSAVSFNYVHYDTTTAGQPSGSGLTLVKSVDRATALPGQDIVYTVTYSNHSSGPLSSIVINDATPYYTLFQSASCGVLPLNLTACMIAAPALNGTGSIIYTMTGTLASGSSGAVTFTVKVQP